LTDLVTDCDLTEAVGHQIQSQASLCGTYDRRSDTGRFCHRISVFLPLLIPQNDPFLSSVTQGLLQWAIYNVSTKERSLTTPSVKKTI
jgi:hypothetical protein